MADFATLDQLAVRLGRTSEDELTEAQRAQGELLIALVSGLIRSAGGKAADWDPDPESILLRAVCLEAAARVMTNPAGVRSEAETLGQHQHSVSYSDGHGAVYLTPAEAKLVRGAAGARSVTTMPGTTLDLLVELRETGEIAAFPAE